MAVESWPIDPKIQAQMPTLTDKQYRDYLWRMSGNSEKIYAGLSIIGLSVVILHLLGVL